MGTSTSDLGSALATAVVMDEDTLTVELSDGRTIAVPLAWYPRLLHGSAEERSGWRLIGQGVGIHWPELDEDISVKNLLEGKPSGESQRSFREWLERRAGGIAGSAGALAALAEEALAEHRAGLTEELDPDRL